MTEFVVTFLAVFALDVVYTYYLRCVGNGEALGASFWAMPCYLLGSLAVISYTSNHWLLVPAMMGAFCGTWVGMKIKSKAAKHIKERFGVEE